MDEGTRVEGGVHFAMADAEFTHRGEGCTFETVLKEFGLAGDPAFEGLAEIVHDIDLKGNKVNRLDFDVSQRGRGGSVCRRDDGKNCLDSPARRA